MARPATIANKLADDFQLRVCTNTRTIWQFTNGAWRHADWLVHDKLLDYDPDAENLNLKVESVRDVALPYVLLERGLTLVADQPDDRFINTSAGLYELSSGKMLPHNPEVMSFSQVPLVPEFKNIRIPVFNKFLSETFDDKGIENYVLDLMAYALVPGNERQHATLLVGSGANGKGTLIRVMENLFRRCDRSAVSVRDMAENRFAAFQLFGRAFNYDADMSSRYISDTSVFKKTTGGDALAMERKYMDPFYAKVWASQWFSVNSIPRSSDTTYGFLRRWDVVEFNNVITKPDLTLEDRIMAELPSIAGFLITRARMNAGTVTKAGSGLQRLAESVDPVRAWLADEDRAPSGWMPRTEAYCDFKIWAESQGIRSLPTSRGLYEQLRAAGVPEKTGVGRQRGTRGFEFAGGMQ